jgi:beta-glucosidase
VLAGTVNPSGKTTDIWAADFTADPTFKNFGGKRYTDIEGYYPQKSTGNAYFVEYVEGLYYGYRYYETAAAEAEAGNYSGFDYDSAVVFPFGYGLSYTTFSQTLDSVNADEENVKVEVTVSNTGSVAGKDVVEVYYSAPYTAGGLEKAAVVLGGFAKTDALDPGASQQVTIEFPVRDMASYSSDDQAYVLDAGDYVISLRTDSHTVVDQKTVTLSAKKYTTDSATEAQISNKFDDMTEYMEKNVKTMSRKDFKGTFPEEAADKSAADCSVELTDVEARGPRGLQRHHAHHRREQRPAAHRHARAGL